jgi:tetratricopeptide (TPR) repeat protein
MIRCNKCNKPFLLKKKYYDYKGKKKGSFEITNEKIYCKKCFESLYSNDEPNIEDVGDMIIKMREGKYKEALKELEKHFDKTKKSDWYNKGNLLRNLKKDKEALECYNEAIFLDTHYIKAWYRKGQTLHENDKFSDAGKCFENVLELEKSILNQDSLQVKPTEKGVVYESNVWSFGAMLMRALAFMGEKKFDEADAIFTLLYRTMGHFPPFNQIEPDDFIQYCVKNAGQILDWLEPNMVAEIGTTGGKH